MEPSHPLDGSGHLPEDLEGDVVPTVTGVWHLQQGPGLPLQS